MTQLQPLQKLQLIVERNDDELWGRVKVKGNLIYDTSNNLESLKKRIKQVVLEQEGVKIESFDISYDLTSFFESHSYLSISDIAKRTDINPGLMRQYASGNKYPSEERVKAIEHAIREIGKELSKVHLHKTKREFV
jgi:transcriptional regulator with XRE-family HTH domain